MKRFLTIIIIILVVLALIFFAAWFFARRQAEERNTTKPTFKEFITGTSKPKPIGNVPGEITPPFNGEDTDNGSTPGENGGAGTGGVGVTQTSQFTSSPLTPAGDGTGSDGNFGGGFGGGFNGGDDGTGTGGIGGSGSGSGTIGGGDGVVDTGSGAGPGNGSNTPVGPVTSQNDPTTIAPMCSDEDLNIVFTPEEINKLNKLQNRFYTVASILHSDADVATELSNYDAFKAKSDRFAELYNYCQAKAPLVPMTQQRVGTPFWRTGSDAEGYITNMFYQTEVDPRQHPDVESSIEHVFRLNLW